MCTYATFQEAIEGSAKGPGGRWMRVDSATVYFDHPVHAMAEHTVNIDLSGAELGPAGRIAVELTTDSAARLVTAIQAAMASCGPRPAGEDPGEG